MHQQPYRADIDGLRAVAVALVLFYHLDFSILSGGFVGVDVFFVISGYLISRNLIEEWASKGRISFKAFYVRRARRILPALLVTIGLTFTVSVLMLSPFLVVKTAESAIWAILSVSNFYFWSEVGYFDTAAFDKPLLHTWSLGVEEQFYLFWPLAIIVAANWGGRKAIFILLVLIGFFSLALNPVFSSGSIPALARLIPASKTWFAEGEANIFYLPPFRLFEFVIGAGVFFAERYRVHATGLNDLFAIIGATMIALSAVIFDNATIFPSFNALLPCLGTALVIWAGAGTLTAKGLATAPMNIVGRRSYSLYLVHWPAIVFSKQFLFRPLTMSESVAVAVASFALASIMYRFIEQPFRRTRGIQIASRRFFIGLSATGLAVILLAGSAIIGDGWQWRIPEGRRAISPTQARELETGYCGGRENGTGLVTCSVDRQAATIVYAWGDSHARHLVAGLANAFPDSNVDILYSSSCMPQSGLFGYFYDFEGRKKLAADCVMRNRAAVDFFRTAQPSLIVLHNFVRIGDAENDLLIDSTRKLIDTLERAGHTVKIIGDVVRPEKDLANCYSVPWYFSDRLIQQRCTGDATTERALQAENTAFGRQLPAENFINMNDFFCSQKHCTTMRDGVPLFRDDHHLTIFGSEEFVRVAVSKGLRMAPRPNTVK